MAAVYLIDLHTIYQYILSALSPGAFPPLPKFTSQKVRQLAESTDMKAYSDLVTAYNSKNTERLGRVADQHTAIYNSVSDLVTLALIQICVVGRVLWGGGLNSDWVLFCIARLLHCLGCCGSARVWRRFAEQRSVFT